MQLKEGTLLQSGKYRIEKVLGQGGFGITYLADQTGLHRKVAIKEFFMKEYCNRDGDTSQVSVPSVGSKELVDKFREKFVKEAQNIASFSHNNIIKIYDVFEENNTAYYVMEYLDCGSLSDYLTDRGRLSEEESLTFIRQIADALSYIHKRKVNHLDVKPGNILLDQTHNAILIDFGLSKHYDERGGQTSSTPVGISHGYAPLEQYKQGGVSTFSPSTDIYSLGATLYKLLTGTTPPEADDVNENGLSFPANVHISGSMKKAIAYAMQPKRKDRPQSIEEFLKALEFKKVTEDEGTDIEIEVKPDPKPNPTPTPNPVPTPRPKNWVLYAVLALVLGIGAYFVYDIIEKRNAEKARIEAELAQAQKEASYKEMLSDKQSYITLIGEGDKLLSGKKYSESINKYEQAQIYEKKYTGTEYSKEFDKRASSKIEAANEAEQAYKAEQARLEKARLEKEQKEREAAEKARLEKERKEREAAETARLEKERKEREAAEKARLEKERQQPGTAEYNRTHGSKSGHDWVDLGLPSGIKWATSNVGASRPEEYGDYFAWGETREKSIYDFDNSVAFGKNISDIKGDSRYDAARANWGGSWRLPTKAELEELEENCTWSWTTQGGKQGCKVTGPNGNSIFLPAAGFRCGTSLGLAGERGDYWSSTPNASDANSACCLRFNSSIQHVGSSDHYYYGRSVRPVSE